ncbi:hypothetical protein N7481_008908 [Penicillium waksmanii]|uniref:uncharacterized protein n=1 Tax=Penicillium waksmanii TaxID=69791 RepID=UPI00254687FC|nr:uncharacterized protein N7481_008908 [Penicillium waksmanii]KAJ5975201.1 hypothetical protein N7481_008908 [Penicillium waksmanii]
MLWLRQILRSKARPSRFYTGPQTITAHTPVRHVRFRRPWLRSFIGKCLFYGVAFHTWTVIVRVYANWDEDPDEKLERRKKPLKEKELLESKRQDKEIAEEEAEEDEPVFIPLTWYLEEQEGEFYTASDPEWQVYSKISKDREKLQKLRGSFGFLNSTGIEPTLTNAR